MLETTLDIIASKLFFADLETEPPDVTQSAWGYMFKAKLGPQQGCVNPQVRDPTASPCSTFFGEGASIELDSWIWEEKNQVQVTRVFVRVFQADPFQRFLFLLSLCSRSKCPSLISFIHTMILHQGAPGALSFLGHLSGSREDLVKVWASTPSKWNLSRQRSRFPTHCVTEIVRGPGCQGSTAWLPLDCNFGKVPKRPREAHGIPPHFSLNLCKSFWGPQLQNAASLIPHRMHSSFRPDVVGDGCLRFTSFLGCPWTGMEEQQNDHLHLRNVLFLKTGAT